MVVNDEYTVEIMILILMKPARNALHIEIIAYFHALAGKICGGGFGRFFLHVVPFGGFHPENAAVQDPFISLEGQCTFQMLHAQRISQLINAPKTTNPAIPIKML